MGPTLRLDNQTRSLEELMRAMNVPIDRQAGELAIISVCCPDRLRKFQDYEDSLKTAEVAG